MKKICLLLCAAVFFAMPCMAEESGKNYIFKADFESYTEGDDVFAYLSSLGFNSTLSASMGDKAEIKDGALSVDISERSGGNPSIKISKSYTQDKDVLVLEFDLKTTGMLNSYQFPQFGSMAQTWMLPNSKDNKITPAFTNHNVTGTNKWTKAENLLTGDINSGWCHFKYMLDVTARKWSVWVTGDSEYTNENMMTGTGDNIDAVQFVLREQSAFMIDNIEYYTMNKMQIKSTTVANGAENVPCEEPIDIEFSEKIDAASLDNVTVSGLAKSDYSVILTNDNTVRINFKKQLAYSKEYTINAENIKAENGLSGDNAIITFTTESAPDVYMQNVDVSSNGDLKTFTVTIANTSTENKQITLFAATYDEYNMLSKMNYVNCTADAETEKTVGLSQKITDGKVRVYLWDGAELMQPYCADFTADFTEGN